MVEKWLNEYLDSGLGTLRKGDGYEFIIYKGFKIVKSEDEFGIIDTRFNDFYTEPTPGDLGVLSIFGFIKGCDYLMLSRDLKRVNTHRSEIESLLEREEVLKKEKSSLSTREHKLEKKFISKSKRDHLDKLFLYKNRIKQTQQKYNLTQEDE